MTDQPHNRFQVFAVDVLDRERLEHWLNQHIEPYERVISILPMGVLSTGEMPKMLLTIEDTRALDTQT